MRPIDADALIEKCGGWYVEEGTESGFIGTLKNLLATMPTIQPVATDTNVGDTISRQAAIDALDFEIVHMTAYCDGKNEGNPFAQYNKGLEDGKKAIEALPPAQPEPQWISVTERLPDNADHPGAFCPRYQVVTPYGVTEGWYRPHDHEKGGQWFALFWFMSQIYEIWNIDFERGDVPKVIGEAPVMEWRPLPEPYKPSK